MVMLKGCLWTTIRSSRSGVIFMSLVVLDFPAGVASVEEFGTMGMSEIFSV